MREERSVITEGMVPVCWPVTFGSLGSRHFLSKGMILMVTASRFHVAGTMPVEVGMRLHLWVSPPAKLAGPLCIRATVVWVQGHEFGLDFYFIGVDDQQWLLDFLASPHISLCSIRQSSVA
jgi:hypothetical protein